MKLKLVFLTSFAFILLFVPTILYSQDQVSPQQKSVDLLTQDATGDLELLWHSQFATPSFIRGPLRLPATARASTASPVIAAQEWLKRYAPMFGIATVEEELVLLGEETDQLGMHHLTYQQVSQGIPVYHRQIRLHLAADGQTLLAASNSFVPTRYLPAPQLGINAAQALAQAQVALPGGKLASEAVRVIWVDPSRSQPTPQVVWLVELWDPTRLLNNIYVIRAVDGAIADVWERTHHARNRKVYSAQNRMEVPGVLVRAEGDPPTGDVDADRAYDFAGLTYDYYFGTLGRDSYDNQGGTMTITVQIGPNYVNAAYIPEERQIVYGNDMVTLDITGHEWTHAVINHTANLEYRWQSGALNESIADIFGAMIDRDDWLFGEDLPASVLRGAEAIRDMADPTRFQQPAHVNQWVATCSDQEGVHTNSGITNKAYYNIATAIGKEKAEQIFYRVLTQYLHATSSLAELRTSALQAAQDLYGQGSAEYQGTQNGFAAVGLNGQWKPPANECLCAVSAALASPSVSPDRLSALNAIATLYRLRDEQLSQSEAGEHYRTLYEEHSNRASALLRQDPDLLVAGGAVIVQFMPGLKALLDGQGNTVALDQAMVQSLRTFLGDLAQADREAQGTALAGMLETEMARIEWDLLVDMSFAEAWAYLAQRLTLQPTSIYLPIIQ
ncbi:MAG: M4 family metallopeptidase [Caldilineaceae bacterium]|nr:M4 family metallopeptidase [Caldilineaceae bacterium]